MAVEGSVPSLGVIVPHLVVRDADVALDFYQRAFAATVLYRSPSPSGVGSHLHLKIWESLIQLSTEEPDQRLDRAHGPLLASPESLLGSTCVFQVSVTSADAAFERALEAGAAPLMPPTDMFWGDRYAWVRDPFGHVWALSEIRAVLNAEEVQERMQDFVAHTREQC